MEEVVMDLGCEHDGEEETKQTDYCLLGSLWTDKPFNTKALFNTMNRVWKLKKAMESKELDRNLFSFHFSSPWDMRFVLDNGLWSFDKSVLILKEMAGDEQPSKLNLFPVPYWVRAYDLPRYAMTKSSAVAFGNRIGEFLEADEDSIGQWGRFLRFKVLFDVRNSLVKGAFIRQHNGYTIWINFKYERLPNFCYLCGCIGHLNRDCELLDDTTEDDGAAQLQQMPYSKNLRASPMKRTVVKSEPEVRTSTRLALSKAGDGNKKQGSKTTVGNQPEGSSVAAEAGATNMKINTSF